MSDILWENIQDHIERLEQLQMQPFSKKMGERESDDTTITSARNRLLSSLAVNQAYLDIAYLTNEWMRTNNKILCEIEEVTKRALALTQSDIANKSDSTSLNEVKSEYRSILDLIINLANTRSNGNYIFAGTKIHIKPFTLNGNRTSFTYDGDDNEISRTLGPGEQVIININGRDIFANLLNSLIKGVNLNHVSDISNLVVEFQISLKILNRIRRINEARHKQVLTSIKQGEQTNQLLQILYSQHDDIDIIEGITNLHQKEIAYKTVLEVSNQALAIINLFDLT
jgi:flagellar hook-associated protein 3 FlgL